jgi:hypothetical protein
VSTQTERQTAYRRAAIHQHHDEGVIEIDENARVSDGADGGAYVQAWVWVSDEDAGLIPPCADMMGCLCAAHAKGRASEGPCDTNEGCDPDDWR